MAIRQGPSLRAMKPLRLVIRRPEVLGAQGEFHSARNDELWGQRSGVFPVPLRQIIRPLARIAKKQVNSRALDDGVAHMVDDRAQLPQRQHDVDGLRGFPDALG